MWERRLRSVLAVTRSQGPACTRRYRANSSVSFVARFSVMQLSPVAQLTVVCIRTVLTSLYVPPGLAFNNSTFCPHSCIYVFCVDLRTNSHYLKIFMCFVWISEQTAIISLYSINWLVCITETVCLLRGTDWVFKNIYVFCVDLWTNSHYFPIQHQLTGLYNRDWVCLLRGTDWVFKDIYVFCVDLRTNSHYFPIQH